MKSLYIINKIQLHVFRWNGFGFSVAFSFVCSLLSIDWVVLWPSQPISVMWSQSVYLTTLLLGRFSHLSHSPIVCHSSARNWHKQKGKNDHRNYFMINLQERMLPTQCSMWLTSIYAHSLTRNWQLPFLNQWKRMTAEIISWSNFMKECGWTQRGSNL